MGPARHSTAPLAPQLPGFLSGTHQLPSQHTTGCNSHPTAPIPTHHGVQQQSLVLSGTKRPMSWGATGTLGPARSPTAHTTLQLPVRHPTAPITPHHEVQQLRWVLPGAQHPSPHTTGCNNRPRILSGTRQAPVTPHRRVQQQPWDPVRHPTAPTTAHDRVQPPSWIPSGTLWHPSSYITGCKTILDPARCPPAPLALQLPGFLPGTEQPPRPHTTG